MNKNFYPTPDDLITKMLRKIRNKNIQTTLEPSAGEGHIVDRLQRRYEDLRSGKIIDCIEIDETMQATLRGKNINVIDQDFLTFAGPDKYDLIIANPPFDEGDKHLLKAIDIMYCGEIIFLLNAETLKNPYTNTRKLLVKELDRLGADIEYIQDGFLDAERKTTVEIALVYINIEKQVEEDLFDGQIDQAADSQDQIDPDYEIQTKNDIKNMVDDFNRVVQVGTETLVNYYKNYNHIRQFIKIANEDGKTDIYYEAETLTGKLQEKLNAFLRDVRKHYWEKVLDLKAVRVRLTTKKVDEFHRQLTKQAYMDFTENNIRTFIINLIGSYEQTLTEAVLDIFTLFTEKHAWSEEYNTENIHYFNGWKTNKAFFVNKKVILPYFNSWDTCFDKWKVGWEDTGKLNDIDTVMNYFDGMNNYNTAENAMTKAFDLGQNKKILSTYFEITAYKKGTLHLTFRSEDIRRRFNVTACKGKKWLPQNYGEKPFEQLPDIEQELVESFEDKKTYNKHLGNCSFAEVIFNVNNQIQEGPRGD